MIAPRARSMTRQRGVSYVEALVAMVVLGLAIVPALDAVQTAVNGAAVTETLLLRRQAVASRLEAVLAEPFMKLADAAGDATVPSVYSDAVGEPDRALVFISLYDGDNADSDGNPFTGKDDGLIWIRVEIEATTHSLETLVSQ